MKKESYWWASKTSQRMKRGKTRRRRSKRSDEGKREADEPSSLSRDRNLIRTLWLWSEAIFSEQEKSRRERIMSSINGLLFISHRILSWDCLQTRIEESKCSSHITFFFSPRKLLPSFNFLVYLLRQLLNYLYFEIQDWLQATRVEIDLFCLTSDDRIQYSENSSWLLLHKQRGKERERLLIEVICRQQQTE